MTPCAARRSHRTRLRSRTTAPDAPPCRPSSPPPSKTSSSSQSRARNSRPNSKANSNAWTRQRRECAENSKTRATKRKSGRCASTHAETAPSQDARLTCIPRQQGKYTTALKDHTTTITHMQRELETLRATEKELRTRVRDMELDNDDLEKSERCANLLPLSSQSRVLTHNLTRAGRRTRRCRTSRRGTTRRSNGSPSSKRNSSRKPSSRKKSSD